jgi:hypothetical protein
MAITIRQRRLSAFSLRIVLGGALATCLVPFGLAADQSTQKAVGILCCEQHSTRLLLLDENADWNSRRAVLWSWSPKECPDIQPAHRPWFGSLTDGKRVLGGTHVIVSASGGGIALVRIKDKRAVFYALAGGNTHSIEILPDGNLVSASSTGGYLRVFSTDSHVSRPPTNVKYAEVKLAAAHGVVWDYRLRRLWAIGGPVLARYRYNDNRQQPALAEEARFRLPNPGGHDLFPVPGTRRLFLTAGKVWTFDTETGTFETLSAVSQDEVKSISQRGPGGPIIVMAATESWWSDTIPFVDGSRQKVMQGARFYKVRWWVPNPFSYGPDRPISAGD